MSKNQKRAQRRKEKAKEKREEEQKQANIEHQYTEILHDKDVDQITRNLEFLGSKERPEIIKRVRNLKKDLKRIEQFQAKLERNEPLKDIERIKLAKRDEFEKELRDLQKLLS